MPDAGQAPLLDIQNLEVSYGAVQVLWGISLSVMKGQVVCIIGPNGAGKTTTLNTMIGVLKPKRGRMMFEGQDIGALPPYQRVQRHIALVPEGRHLWPGMSVEDNLMMGAFPPAFRSRWVNNVERVYAMFPRLKERRHQLAGTLSGGEQQMCAIGRGLMAEPHLLLLDEPSLGLGPIVVDEIFRFVSDIVKHGVTILLVAQNIDYALEVSNYGYVMETGHIVLEGSSDMLLKNPHVQQAYLGGSVEEPGAFPES
ncbi:MAG TPA: ABC transporter ATP-binding protein [Terriglobales bacterium]|nr:ABC transporter ATP-binding protein [Terriglobales bacterium]